MTTPSAAAETATPGQSGRAGLALCSLLDAGDLATTAHVLLPRRVPAGIHGSWIPEGVARMSPRRRVGNQLDGHIRQVSARHVRTALRPA